MPKKRKFKKAAKTLAKAAVAGGVAGLAGTKIGSMAKQIKSDMKPVKTSSSKKPIESDLKINNENNIPSWAKEIKKNKQKAYDNRITMRTDKAPTKQMAPIDPRTGMPIQTSNDTSA